MAWLPDLFAQLWVQLIPRTSDIFSMNWSGRQSSEARQICKDLRATSDGEVPASVLAYLQDAHPVTWRSVRPGCDGRDQRAFVVAQCIDEVFESLHPRNRHLRRRLEPGLQPVDRYYREHGRYNHKEPWLVLPKSPLRFGRAARSPGVGDNELKGLFAHLVCFHDPEPRAREIVVRRLPERHDIQWTGETTLRVALIPLAERADDLELKTSDKYGGRLFVRPREDELARRAGDALRQAESEGAHLALFPEFAVSPAINQAIGKTIREIFADAGGEPNLRLVVAGSGLTDMTHDESGLPFNESTVYGHGGRELWRQQKLNHYAVPKRTVKSWDVEDVDAVEYREAFHQGRELHVVDSALGRMTVLICQDLWEDEPSHRLVSQLRPDWIFCPVMDSEIQVGRWSHQRAYPLADRYGVSTVVANSLTLAKRLKPKVRKVKIGLCVDGDNAFRHLLVRVKVPGVRAKKPALVLIDWQVDEWEKLKIGSEKPSSSK